MIPVGVTAGTAYQAPKEDHIIAWISLSILEVTFFVNAAGLFMLSSLIEKSKNTSELYEKTKKGSKPVKELTSVKMPPALIEGFESLILFGAIIVFP